MDYNENSIFDDKIRQEFLKDGFYAKPISTKIYLSLGKDNESIVGNSVVMNLEESNEKIPIYSYNSDLYKKYLNGKKIITGYIAMRKVTISSFLSLFKKTEINNELSKKIQDLEYVLEELNKTNPITDEVKIMIESFKKELNILKEKSNNDIYEEDLYINNIELSEELKNDNLLYYIDKNYNSGKSDISIKIVFEGNLNSPVLNIYDVLLVKKQTEININKNDIIEIYQFIGNPDKNL